jgi:cytochrome c55X
MKRPRTEPRTICALLECGAAVAILMFSAPFAFAGPPASERQGDLLHLLKHDCGSCHGLTMKGGLGPPLLPETLDGKGDQGLVEIILDGVPGTPMPPWRDELSRDEAAWMVQNLRKGLPQ